MSTTAGGSRQNREAGGGWSHPPRLPATGRWRRLADRFLDGVQSIGNWGLLAVVLGAFFVASLLPDRIGVWIAVLLYLAVGLYCSVNFWRCREAHCAITGAGFTLLGFGLLAEALGVHTVIGEYNGLIALGVLVVAVAFEGVVRASNGTNAVGGARTRGRDFGC